MTDTDRSSREWQADAPFEWLGRSASKVAKDIEELSVDRLPVLGVPLLFLDDDLDIWEHRTEPSCHRLPDFIHGIGHFAGGCFHQHCIVVPQDYLAATTSQ